MKDFILRQIGRRYKSLDFLKRNKLGVGMVFYALTGYVLIFGCPGLHESCDKLALVVANIGSFLTGAGLIPSDFREKVVQGRVDIAELVKDEAEKKEENN